MDCAGLADVDEEMLGQADGLGAACRAPNQTELALALRSWLICMRPPGLEELDQTCDELASEELA